MEISRPEKKNAFNRDLYAALAQALESGLADPAVRVVLLHGQPEIFSAGNDIGEFVSFPPSDPDSPAVRFLRLLADCPKPMIAAVSGAAIGIGTTLLLHFDAIYASDTARFSVPFTHLGLTPEGGSSLLMPLILGYQKAAEMLLFGDAIDAREAYQAGLVNKVLPVEELLPYARDRAANLAARSPWAVAQTKSLLRQSLTNRLGQTMSDEFAVFSRALETPEARAAFAAFFNR
ncbi:MAG: enoyl-CoA hydratase/isomerase family protein [Proteobacteria bacterium]|nr:enoyl-CoA hydratase/isomerase family protein [Pseudomonadota bacterium]